MPSNNANHYGVHLIGSMPHQSLNTVKDVFQTLCSSLPGRLARVPDGELGERYYYVNWQARIFSPQVLRRGITVTHSDSRAEPLPVNSSYKVSLEDVKPLEYDVVAIESYKEFCSARTAGVIPQGTRFQISLPAPLEAIAVHVEPAYQAKVYPFYEMRMLEALKAIQSAIPASDLAIQWDFAVCVGFIEYERGNLAIPFFQPWFSNAKEVVLDTAKRVMNATNVQDGVSVGLHLCYGDIEHHHFMEPEDLGLSVELTNEIARIVANSAQPASGSIKNAPTVTISSIAENDGDHEEASLSIEAKGPALGWVHMPVPKGRTDDAYFAALRALNIDPRTELFLGVVHYDDLEGTKKRIQVAEQHVPTQFRDFGVATECGMGRTPKDQLASILEIAKEVSSAY